VGGAALLTLVLVGVPGRAQSLFRIAITGLSRWWVGRNAGNELRDGPHASSAGTWASFSDVVPGRWQQNAAAESAGSAQSLASPGNIRPTVS
jgi:hypothetical protein